MNWPGDDYLRPPASLPFSLEAFRRLGRSITTRVMAAAIVAMPALACTVDDTRSFVTLADTAVQLGPAVTVLRSVEPASAADDLNGVCIALSEGDTLNDDWTLPGLGGQAVTLRAEAVLTDSSVVALPVTASMGEFCLHPERQGPLASPVREVRLWASGPFVARQVTWISTHK